MRSSDGDAPFASFSLAYACAHMWGMMLMPRHDLGMSGESAPEVSSRTRDVRHQGLATKFPFPGTFGLEAPKSEGG